MKIIMNAVDVGMHPAIARAVQVLAEKGVVQSASVVANGQFADDAVQLKGISVGVHLDILRGRPLTHWQHVSSLCDANGMFLISPVQLFKKYVAGKLDHEHVEVEFRRQIERIVELGVEPTHITSHKHVHGWPSFSRMVANLAREYSIPWVRKPVECSEIAALDKSGYPSKFKNVCGFFDREDDVVSWTDGCWSTFDHKDDLSPDNVLEGIGRGSSDQAVYEVSCHPGLVIGGDDIIPQYINPTEISALWRRDYASLDECEWVNAMKKAGHVTCGFDDLC